MYPNNNPNMSINDTIQGLLALKNAGRNPNQIMQILIQQNPQAQQMLTQLQNMAQGKDPRQFLSQLARQNGVSPQNISAIMQMLGN